MILPIVGQNHYPPAKVILSIIPVGQELELIPEPDNQYTTEEFPNAIAVWINGSTISSPIADETESLFQGFGFNSETILTEYWKLGMIAKEFAKNLELTTLPSSGRFTIGSNGGPRVEIKL
jgi:hypothetical protein